MIQEIHEARAKNLELSEEEFNKWIVSKNFYANGISLSVIAYILHTTSEWVRQLEKKAISKLRRPNFPINIITQSFYFFTLKLINFLQF